MKFSTGRPSSANRAQLRAIAMSWHGSVVDFNPTAESLMRGRDTESRSLYRYNPGDSGHDASPAHEPGDLPRPIIRSSACVGRHDRAREIRPASQPRMPVWSSMYEPITPPSTELAGLTSLRLLPESELR